MYINKVKVTGFSILFCSGASKKWFTARKIYLQKYIFTCCGSFSLVKPKSASLLLHEGH